MKEYAALRAVSWILRIGGGLCVLLGLAMLVISLVAGDGDAKGMFAAFGTFFSASALFAGLLLYAAGDAVECLADIARNTARTAQASEAVSSIVMSQVALAQQRVQSRR